ncbi:TetR/AcrR family transcriptional regulator [Campylobacter sp.]|uniref:TetR/AcrR family transcriptional regulator n=1 Tax=Campylobacter sp. TaxID=205 RepID=UPI002A7EED53|nr:TetR/AcrR family transcriptional regulator [Campylobacter sp.]MDY4803588.1 TetR/AcrR family transcriptional regulator [Campylobacter sp.]
MNKKKIAETLEIEIRTLYNWEKTRPKLYEFIIKAFENKNIENENNTKIIEIFSKLSEKEKEFYITDMKARILKKELE